MFQVLRKRGSAWAGGGDGSPLQVVQFAKAGSASTDSLNVVYGASVTAGNLLIVAIGTAAGSAVTPPAGWDELGNNTNDYHRLTVFKRTAAEGDGTTFAFTVASAGAMLANAFEIEGAAANPINAFGMQNTTNAGSYSGPSRTPSVLGCLAITVTASEKGISATPPAGNVFGRIETTAGPYVASLVKYRLTEDTATGITQTITFTGGTGRAIGATILVEPTTPGDTPVQLKQFKSASVAGGTNFTLTLDSSPVSGNLLVAFVTCSAYSVTTFTPPTGWTLLDTKADNNGGKIYSYYKVSDGEEGTTITFTAAASTYGGLLVHEVENVAASNQINTNGTTKSSGAQATLTSATLTPTAMETLGLFGFCCTTRTSNGTSVGSPDGWLGGVAPGEGNVYSVLRLRRTKDTETGISSTLTWNASAVGASASVLIAP